jgi:hypothetical protein
MRAVVTTWINHFPGSVKNNIEKVKTYPCRSVNCGDIQSGLFVVLLLELHEGSLH